MDMYFLYFPTDKTEYIPAFITLVIFMIGAVATMYMFYKKSKKEEKYFDDKYDDIDQLMNDQSQEEQKK